jgi:hypothetical protein
MKKQKTKKQTAAKCCAAKTRQPKPKTKSVVKTKAKTKPVTVTPKPVAKAKAVTKKRKSVAAISPSVVEPVVRTTPITTLPAPIVKTDNRFESDELQRIELALAEAEQVVAGIAVPTVRPIPSGMITEITELLDELIVTSSPRAVSTVSRLAYVLCGVMPGLQAVSERADIVLCRKNGVTFGWDRRAEEERAVRSGKRQKCITVS